MPKISSLSIEATTVNSVDWFVMEQGGVTKKVRAAKVGGGGGGGGFSSQNVKVASWGLGGVSAGSLSFFSVTSVAQRGLVTLFQINPSAPVEYDVEVYDAGSATANKMLIAYSIVGTYQVSAPWYIEVASGQGETIHIGIRNRHNDTRSFFLTNLRVERFA